MWPRLHEFGAPELRKLLKISILRMVQRFLAVSGGIGTPLGKLRRSVIFVAPGPAQKRKLRRSGIAGLSCLG